MKMQQENITNSWANFLCTCSTEEMQISIFIDLSGGERCFNVWNFLTQIKLFKARVFFLYEWKVFFVDCIFVVGNDSGCLFIFLIHRAYIN